MPSSELVEELRSAIKEQHPLWFRETVILHALDEPCLLGKQHTGYCKREGIYMYVHGYKSDDGEYIEKQFSAYDSIPPFVEENGKVYKKVWTFLGFQIK